MVLYYLRGLSSAYDPSSNITLYCISRQLWILTTLTMKMKSKSRLGKAAEDHGDLRRTVDGK